MDDISWMTQELPPEAASHLNHSHLVQINKFLQTKKLNLSLRERDGLRSVTVKL